LNKINNRQQIFIEEAISTHSLIDLDLNIAIILCTYIPLW